MCSVRILNFLKNQFSDHIINAEIHCGEIVYLGKTLLYTARHFQWFSTTKITIKSIAYF